MNTNNPNETKVQYVACCYVPGSGWVVFWGILLLILGGLGLASTILPLQHFGQYVLPALLLLWGGYLLLQARRS